MSQRERVIQVHCPGNAAELAPCSLTLFWTGFAAAAQHEAGERDRTQVERQDLSLLCIRCINPTHQGVLAQTPKPPREEAAHAVGRPQHLQGFCTDEALVKLVPQACQASCKSTQGLRTAFLWNQEPFSQEKAPFQVHKSPKQQHKASVCTLPGGLCERDAPLVQKTSHTMLMTYPWEHYPRAIQLPGKDLLAQITSAMCLTPKTHHRAAQHHVPAQTRLTPRASAAASQRAFPCREFSLGMTQPKCRKCHKPTSLLQQPGGESQPGALVSPLTGCTCFQ